MSVQSTIIKTLMRLPEGVLVRMSGGKPVELGGRRLDPRFQFFAHAAAKQPAMSTQSAADARAGSAEALAMLAPPCPAGVTVSDFALSAPGRDIPVRLYMPKEQDARSPIMVYLHMGGGVIGDLDICHAFCGVLAETTGGPILSVDYRLAPEHKFPAGLEDCLFAYEWALKNAAAYGAPAGHAALGGDSMGGNFAAIITQEMQRQHKPLPDLQLLIYPATDLTHDYASRATYGETYPLSTETMDWFMQHYLPDGQDRADLRISPMLSGDVSELSQAIVITAGFDPLSDEGEAYAEKLTAAGVTTEFKCYETLAHGFTAFMGVAPAARTACVEIAERVKRAYLEQRRSHG